MLRGKRRGWIGISCGVFDQFLGADEVIGIVRKVGVGGHSHRTDDHIQGHRKARVFLSTHGFWNVGADYRHSL